MTPCRKLRTVIPFVLFIALYHGFYVVLQTHWNLKSVQIRPPETPQIVNRRLAMRTLKEMLSVSEILAEIRIAEDLEQNLGKRVEKQYDSLQDVIRDFEQKLRTETKTAGEHKRKLSSKENRNNFVNSPVCGEIYKGSSYGYPFFHKGFITANCSKSSSPSSLITILFDHPRHAHTTSTLFGLGRDVSRLYPGIVAYIPIAGRPGSESYVDFKPLDMQIKFEYYDDGVSKKGKVLQKVINKIKTPFTLIAQDVTAFTSDINLERLIRVLTSNSDDVLFAGGAVRTPTGKWYNGCLQSQLKNYTLQYKTGYFKSYSECLICNDLQGPFLVRTSTLQNLTFDETFNHFIYRDLFLRAAKRFGRNSKAIVSCPDVMFEAKLNSLEDSEMIYPFVDKYEIDRITDTNGKILRFACNKLYRSGVVCPHRNAMAVKPCCLEKLAKAVKFILAKCRRYGIICELQEGTLLGAIKMNKVLPWERDADITFLSSQFDKMTQMKEDLQRAGYMLLESETTSCCVEDRVAGGKFDIVADGWVVELFGQHKMETEMLLKKGQKPTQVLFDGEWVNVPRNPGQHIRNRYGPGVYRHAEHWTATGADSGWAEYDTSAGFGQCPMTGHNACLDQYDADGVIQFENNWSNG